MDVKSLKSLLLCHLIHIHVYITNVIILSCSRKYKCMTSGFKVSIFVLKMKFIQNKYSFYIEINILHVFRLKSYLTYKGYRLTSYICFFLCKEISLSVKHILWAQIGEQNFGCLRLLQGMYVLPRTQICCADYKLFVITSCLSGLGSRCYTNLIFQKSMDILTVKNFTSKTYSTPIKINGEIIAYEQGGKVETILIV